METEFCEFFPELEEHSMAPVPESIAVGASIFPTLLSPFAFA
jgi:hypothetical protein